MKGYILFALALLALLLSSCGGGHSPTATASSAISSSSSAAATAGRIVVGVVPIGLKRTAVATADSFSATSLEFGTFKMSKGTFLIFKNVGGAAIESLTVTTSEEFATITPGYIPVLNTDQTTSIQQIAELDIYHGSDILNRSFRKPLLSYGRHVFTLSFRGVSAGQPFSADFTVGLSAVYTDVIDLPDNQSLFGSNGEYNGVKCSLQIGSATYTVGDTIPVSKYSLQNSPAGFYSTDCAMNP